MTQPNTPESSTGENLLVAKIDRGLSEVLSLFRLYFSTLFCVSAKLISWWSPTTLSELRNRHNMLGAPLFYWLTALILVVSMPDAPSTADFSSLSRSVIEDLGLSYPVGAVTAFGCAYVLSGVTGWLFRKSPALSPTDVRDAVLYVLGCVCFVRPALTLLEFVLPTILFIFDTDFSFDADSDTQPYYRVGLYVSLSYIGALCVGLALASITSGLPTKRTLSRLPHGAFILVATTGTLVLTLIAAQPALVIRVLKLPHRLSAPTVGEARTVRCEGNELIECSFFLHAGATGYFESTVEFEALYDHPTQDLREPLLHSSERVQGTVRLPAKIDAAGLVPLEDGGLYTLRVPQQALCRALMLSAIPAKGWKHSTWSGWWVQSTAYTQELDDVIERSDPLKRRGVGRDGLVDLLEDGRAPHERFSFVLTGLDAALWDLEQRSQSLAQSGEAWRCQDGKSR